MDRIAALLPVVLVAAWPALADAARFPPEAPGPPMGVGVDGFPQVMGPAATSPENADRFVCQDLTRPCPPSLLQPSAPAAPAPPPSQH